jgi:hypothetical protein
MEEPKAALERELAAAGMVIFGLIRLLAERQ